MKRYPKRKIETCLAWFLFHYRATVYFISGRTPAELIMCQCWLSLLEVLQPNVAEKYTANGKDRKRTMTTNSKDKRVEWGGKVFVCNFGSGPKSLFGKVTRIQSPRVIVLIQLQPDGHTIPRQFNQVQAHYSTSPARQMTNLKRMICYPCYWVIALQERQPSSLGTLRSSTQQRRLLEGLKGMYGIFLCMRVEKCDILCSLCITSIYSSVLLAIFLTPHPSSWGTD